MRISKIIHIACLLFLIVIATSQIVVAANWKTVTTITGSEDQNSPNFKVTAQEWRLHWSYTPSPNYPSTCFFGVAVFEEGEPIMVDSFYNNGSTQLTGEELIHRGNATFYLVILSANIPSYTIIVEQDQNTSLAPLTESPNQTNYTMIVAAIIIIVAITIATVFYQKRKREISLKTKASPLFLLNIRFKAKLSLLLQSLAASLD
jgi:hypothetical protein